MLAAVPTPNLDGSDTLVGRSGKSLYISLRGDFPEEVSDPSKVSRLSGVVPPRWIAQACGEISHT